VAIHIQVLADLDERRLRQETEKLAGEFDKAGARASERFSNRVAQDIGKASPKIQRAMHGIVTATDSAKTAQEKYNAAVERFGEDSDQAAQASRRLSAAVRGQADAHRAASIEVQRHWAALDKQREAAEKSRIALEKQAAALRDSQRPITAINDSLQTLGTNALRTGRGIAAIAAPAVIAALWQTGRVALTASQSLGMLPAVVTAAADRHFRFQRSHEECWRR
jgi:chromosome segregation ATPase